MLLLLLLLLLLSAKTEPCVLMLLRRPLQTVAVLAPSCGHTMVIEQ